jgi:hypothetical protein
MGHHRKSRSTWLGLVTAGVRGAHRAQARVPEPAPEPAPAPKPPSLATRVSSRPIEELAEAARTARRTGWPFLTEIQASADTRAVPTATLPPWQDRPRRAATHQPTAPILVLGRS